jgi:nucleoid-associated protein YgaU
MPRATMTRLDKGGNAVGTRLTVAFNPKELTFSRSITWNPKKSPKADQPEVEFGGGGAASLKLQLLFDTYVTADEGAPVEDVRKKYLNYLYEWTRVDKKLTDGNSKKGRPPEVRFEWGEIIFDGVIQSISQRLTLFLPNGRPVRAVVDLTLTESRDAKLFPSQNPTSGGIGGERVWVVREGDTLPWIAYREYNDATQWRPIADANGLTQVRRLVPGATLVIPSV